MNLFRKPTSKTLLTDKELVARYKQYSDRAAMAELFERYTHLVFGVCMKYLKNEDDAKDATIQIFEKLLDDLKNFEVDNFTAWLHKVCRNYCLMELRKQQTIQKKQQEFQLSNRKNMEFESEVHLIIENNTESQIENLHKGLSQLSTEQKTCLELFYLQDKSYQEIVSITGYDNKQVKSYIQNGKRNLKNMLGNTAILLLFFNGIF